MESVVLPSGYKKQLKSTKKSEKELQEEKRLFTLNVAVSLAFFIIEKLFGQRHFLTTRAFGPYAQYPYIVLRRCIIRISRCSCSILPFSMIAWSSSKWNGARKWRSAPGFVEWRVSRSQSACRSRCSLFGSGRIQWTRCLYEWRSELMCSTKWSTPTCL